MRGIAAVVVFTWHAEGTWWGAGSRSLIAGTTAVSFFFILSGFVLTWSATGTSSQPPRRTFYLRRFARVYPAYATVIAIGTFAALFIERTPVHVLNLAAVALLVQSWVPSAVVYYSIVGVAWSLSCEAFFYLVFPVVLPRLRRLSPAARAWLMVALVAVAIAIPSLVRSTDHDHGIGFWAIYVFPPTRFLEFVLGMLVGLRIRDGARSRLSLTLAGLIALAAFALAGVVPIYLTWVAVTLVPYLLLIQALAGADIDGTASWLRRPALVWLGERSYAFYLVHQLVLAAVRHVCPELAPGPAMAAAMVSLAIALLAATFLHRLIEEPLARHWRGRALPAEAPALAPARPRLAA